MTSRFRLALFACSLAMAGCGDQFNAGPLRYVESETMGVDLKGKPKLQDAVRKALANLYGRSPQEIKVPPGSGLPNGGIYLANRAVIDGQTNVPHDPRPGDEAADRAARRLLGSIANHCLHCHGVSGAGDGPTSTFLFPRPRDYRKGLFKFTSTRSGAKPTREDLRKTIRNGLHGTSMPAFEALMSPAEIEQVIDYIDLPEHAGRDRAGPDRRGRDGRRERPPTRCPTTWSAKSPRASSTSGRRPSRWSSTRRCRESPPTRESVLRGRELFLGLNQTGNKVDCTSCHGPQAVGDGPSFVKQDVFNDVVFGGDPSEQEARLQQYEKKVPGTAELWKQSLDDWGDPLRPNNLNQGRVQGGPAADRPLLADRQGDQRRQDAGDNETIEPERIWDLVNFVLALPYEPKLLEGATLPTTHPATAPAVARH